MDTAQKNVFLGIIFISLFLAILLVVFILFMVRQQRLYHRINREKINAEITTLERERRRIAEDLHDEIGPLLSAVKLHINNISHEDEINGMLIGKSSKFIDEVIARMRGISNDLLPNLLVRMGLVPAIHDFVNKLENTGNLKILFRSNESIRYDKTIETNVFRIVQEIVHNAIKHSEAENLKIQLQLFPDRIVLKTEDDGKGFDDKKAMISESRGLGLLNLQSRAEIMEADFSFRSSTGKGTNYMFEIPALQEPA